MTKIMSIVAAALALIIGAAPQAAQARTSDAQVRREMIRESLASYPGRCPCPYNLDRAGRACGRRSAYSRPGGYAPLCYPRDISDSQVQAYRLRLGG